MAFVNIGYDGSVNEVGDAQRSPHIGSLTPVVTGGADSLKATINSAADRTITIAPGTASGQGLFVTSNANVSVQFDTITTGFRWDVAVLRRDWTTNTSSIIKVTNNAVGTEALPSGLQNNPGVTTDQVLCRARITAGQTTPTALVDMRARASKVISAPDLLSVPFPELGMVVELTNGIRYRYALDASNNPTWLRLAGGVVKLTASGAWNSEAGWTGTSQTIQSVITDTAVHFSIELRRSGGRIIPSASGSISDQKVGVIVGERPEVIEPFSFIYYGGSDASTYASFGGVGEVRPDGGLWIMALAPSAAINTRAAPGTSFRAHVTYARTGL